MSIDLQTIENLRASLLLMLKTLQYSLSYFEYFLLFNYSLHTILY